MFFLDLKRASVAIASGRLDDAFNMLQTSEQREHRDGQQLIDRLTTAFVDRANQHLNDNRLASAQADILKAAKLSGPTSTVTDLQEKISAAETDHQNQRRRHDDAIAMARHQIRAGAYTVGAKLLDGLSDSQSTGTAAARQLRESIETKRAIVEASAARIQSALDADNFRTAVEIINTLPPDQQSHSQIAELTERAVSPLAKLALKEFSNGRLDRATVMSNLLQPHQSVSDTVGELQRCLSQSHIIHEQLSRHQYAEALSQLAVLGQMTENAAWMIPIKSAVEQILNHRNTITESPLELLNVQLEQHHRPTFSEPTAGLPVPFREPTASPPTASLSTSFRHVLQVDGIGSLLMLSNDFISIGASGATGSSTLDVALQTEGHDASLTIRRDGDDYFATSESPFNVNGRHVTRRLLISGDSIAVGSRGRLKFLKPVAASSSAVLQITGSRLAQRDIRHIVLMSDSLLFGPINSHFRVHDIPRPIVLYRGDGTYALQEAVLRSSVPEAAVQPVSKTLRTGDSAEISDVRFRLMDV